MTPPLYYLHIPKTAGTSLNSYLDRQFEVEEVCPVHLLPDLFDIPLSDLQKYKLFRGHFWYGLNSYLKKELTYITMLRDPVQRVISWYAHAKRDPGAERHSRIVNENWSLLDFVQDSEGEGIINVETLFLAADFDYPNFPRQSVGYIEAKKYAENLSDQALLDKAKIRLEQFEFFGITERMQNSMQLLSYTTGFYPEFPEQRLNVSGNRPAENEISAATIEAIKKATQLDQALYDWALPIFEERFNNMVKSLLVSHCKTERSITEAVAWHSPLPIEQRRLFQIKALAVPLSVGVLTNFQITVKVENNSSFRVGSYGTCPFNISYHWIDKVTGDVLVFEGVRSKVQPVLPAGGKAEKYVSVVSPDKAGEYVLRLTLVQEGVAWFDENGKGVFTDINITVQ